MASSAEPIECPPLTAGTREAVFERLRTERGFTIIFRHADKLGGSMRRKKNLTPVITNLDCKKFNERLNDHGVTQADIIRAAFVDLKSRYNFHIDQVIASNSCRALETARIAFGVTAVRKAKDQNLNIGNENITLHKRVRMDIGSKNRVLVSHSGEINTALNVENVLIRKLGCGEAAVLKLEAEDRSLSCLARVLPEEWSDPSFKLTAKKNKNYYKHERCWAGALTARSTN